MKLDAIFDIMKNLRILISTKYVDLKEMTMDLKKSSNIKNK